MRSSPVLCLLLVAAPAVADPAASNPPAPATPVAATTEPLKWGLALAGGVGETGLAVGGQIAYRLGASAVIVDVGVRRGRWYPRGVPTDDLTTVQAAAGARWTLRDRGIAALELTATAGVWRMAGADPLLAIGGEVDATAVLYPRPGLRLHSGLTLPVALTTGGEVDRLEQRLHAGADLEVAANLWLTTQVYGGGGYGYDGDGTKFDAGVLVGVRAAGRVLRPARARQPGASAFVATGYRALAIGGHRSHGLGYALGAALLGGHLRVGIAGFNRPGPINRTTFKTRPVDGQTWNGATEVALRSDGNFVGLHLAPTVTVGPIELSLPVTFGQAAFGFYLHGADRAAVSGERVSAVEDRLFAGKDSSFALGAEAGLSAAWQVTDWFAPVASVHYLTTIGYAALDRDSYGGFSGSLGIELTP